MQTTTAAKHDISTSGSGGNFLFSPTPPFPPCTTPVTPSPRRRPPPRRLVQTQLLAPAYAIGARISTNSWGAIRTTYTSLDRQMDAFAYDNPDMVIVVAGGNCGDEISECTYQVNVTVFLLKRAGSRI